MCRPETWSKRQFCCCAKNMQGCGVELATRNGEGGGVVADYGRALVQTKRAIV